LSSLNSPISSSPTVSSLPLSETAIQREQSRLFEPYNNHSHVRRYVVTLTSMFICSNIGQISTRPPSINTRDSNVGPIPTRAPRLNIREISTRNDCRNRNQGRHFGSNNRSRIRTETFNGLRLPKTFTFTCIPENERAENSPRYPRRGQIRYNLLEEAGLIKNVEFRQGDFAHCQSQINGAFQHLRLDGSWIFYKGSGNYTVLRPCTNVSCLNFDLETLDRYFAFLLR
jgi:hypothetical protein